MPVSSSDGKPVQPEPWAYGVDWEMTTHEDGAREAVAYNGPEIVGRVIGRGLRFQVCFILTHRRLLRRYGPLRRGAR